MKDAMKLQTEMLKKQEEIKKVEVGGEAAGGMVKVTMTCGFEVKLITIGEEIWKENDKDMLADLIAAAFNNALRKAQDVMAEEMSKLTGGLGIQLPNM